MNSKIYQKPSFSMAKIEMNDLCSGSNPQQMRVGMKRGTAAEKTLLVTNTEGHWDSEF